jgi:hypothetical protein
VAIVIQGKTNYDGGAKTFLVREDEAITWKAYWDPSGTSAAGLAAGLGAAATFEGKPMYEIDDYSQAVKSGGNLLKVSEITSKRGGDAITDAGGTISGSTFEKIGGSYNGSNVYPTINVPQDMAHSSAPVPGTTYTWFATGSWTNMGTWEMAENGFEVIWTLNEDQTMSLGDQPTAFTGNTLPYVYKTPSADGEVGVSISAVSSIKLNYESGGGMYQWSEVKKDGSGAVVESGGNYSIQWAGELNRTGEGENQECSVIIEDVSGPIGYAITPTTISGETGVSPGDSFTVKVADNYPHSNGSITGTLCYSTVLNDWEKEPGEKELCGDQYHPHPSACNCMAYHKEKWVWKTVDFSGGSRTIINGTDGFPAYSIYEVTIPNSIEPLPWHFADNAYSYNYKNGDYLKFESCQLKALVVAQDHHGFGPSPPYSDGEENPEASATIALESPVDVVTANPDDSNPNPPKSQVFSAMGRSGEAFGLWAGIQDIDDKAMPDIRVFVKDTKYNWTFLYGHQNSLDGSIAGYKAAREGGTGSSDTNNDSPYQSGPEAPAEWIFSDEMDYADQLEMIRNGGFAPMHSIAEGTGAWGFWADEDSRLVFKVVCRDNMNQWDKEPTYTVQINDGPGGVTMDGTELDMVDGEFEYIFRDPNRGDGITPNDCTLTVTAIDDSGNSRKMIIHFFIACNELTLRTLEEERHQVDSW